MRDQENVDVARIAVDGPGLERPEVAVECKFIPLPQQLHHSCRHRMRRVL